MPKLPNTKLEIQRQQRPDNGNGYLVFGLKFLTASSVHPAWVFFALLSTNY
jgi:hypothetical protein